MALAMELAMAVTFRWCSSDAQQSGVAARDSQARFQTA